MGFLLEWHFYFYFCYPEKVQEEGEFDWIKTFVNLRISFLAKGSFKQSALEHKLLRDPDWFIKLIQ